MNVLVGALNKEKLYDGSLRALVSSVDKSFRDADTEDRTLCTRAEARSRLPGPRWKIFTVFGVTSVALV